MLPVLFMVLGEISQVIPAEDATVMAVTECQCQGVVAGGSGARDLDTLFAVLKYFLSGTMSFHLRTG